MLFNRVEQERSAAIFANRLTYLFLLLWTTLSGAAPVRVDSDASSPLGLSSEYLTEQENRLNLGKAMAAYGAGRFSPGLSPALNFSMGSPPVWLRFAVDNPNAQPVTRRLSVETSWLDHVEAYVRQPDGKLAEYAFGDRQPHPQRPIASRHFSFDQVFDPGLSEVYLRIDTPDPMVIPLYLASPDAAILRDERQALSYGFVYGFLLALMAYNLTLFASFRSTRYFYYALYLGAFVLMNFSYTGFAYAWLWPESPALQKWGNIVLMYVFAESGLLFATRFLDTRENLPHFHKLVLYLSAGTGVLLALAIVMNQQTMALFIVFPFMILFNLLMLFLGIAALRGGQKPAFYFLAASVASIAGMAATNLTVWGFLPFNAWTFRAVEIGMMVDAVLLAMALVYQFRIVQAEKERAEDLAQHDPLTGLNNRRAFYDKTAQLWSVATRNRRNASVMLIDIDLFKHVNDRHGHAHGDQVLVVMAGTLRDAIRQGDVLARWGGEEFILFLPETDLGEARDLAERLRAEIAEIRVPNPEGVTAFTASFGVAQREDSHVALDALIAAADRYLYQAKEQGRNRVGSRFGLTLQSV